MSRHRNLRQMIDEDYYDYDEDDYDDYDDTYVAPKTKPQPAQTPQKSKQQPNQGKKQPQQQQQQQSKKNSNNNKAGPTTTTPTKSASPATAIQSPPPTKTTAVVTTPSSAIKAKTTPQQQQLTPVISSTVTTTENSNKTDSPPIPAILLSPPSSSSSNQQQPLKRTPLTVVVLGHVDAGKSTITGHLLYHAPTAGAANGKSKAASSLYSNTPSTTTPTVVHTKNQKSKVTGSGGSGKKSMSSPGPASAAASQQQSASQQPAAAVSGINYAWLLDEDEQERDHGITMDIATKAIQSATKFDIVLQDAPGHADYVPAAITGTASADAALLTVGATDFRASFGSGQLREHALLARGLGVKSILVVVTKMDLIQWSQQAYTAILTPLMEFLTNQVGFAPNKVRCIPVSGITGDNVFTPPNTATAGWYQGPTLWQALDEFDAPVNQQAKLLEKPARILLTDVYGAGGNVRAKVAQGWVKAGDELMIWPLGDTTRLTKFKRILAMNSSTTETEETGERAQYAVAGEMLDVQITGVDAMRLSPGHVLTRPHQRPPLSNKCQARIWLLSGSAAATVIIKGSQVIFHMHSMQVPCHFSNLIRTLQKDGTTAKERPRALTTAGSNASGSSSSHNSNATQIAIVELTLMAPIVMEPFIQCRALGRFVLRRAGDSIAVGRIEQVL